MVIATMSLAARSVCVPCLRMFMRGYAGFPNYTRIGLRLKLVTTSTSWTVRGYCTDKTNYIEDDNTHGEVYVEYVQGLPHLTVPLPSRNEKCRFSLKPLSHNVGDLLTMLRTEDRGIDRAMILNTSGVRIASTCNIESVLDDCFWLFINDYKYKVIPPKREKIHFEDVSKLGDVRALVVQLYEALHVGEYHIKKEQELAQKLEDLKYRLAPLEEEKIALAKEADRRVNILTWAGLGFMSMQFGILARLTWWEYSWDIMEPVTYFVTYGTAMAMYAYYCITKTEYNLNEVKDRTFLINIHRRAKKKNFDVDEYNNLKRHIAEIEYDLRRLRDPINMRLPPHVDKSEKYIPPTDGDQRGPMNGPAICTDGSGDSSSTTTTTGTKSSTNAADSKKKTKPFRFPFFHTKN